MFILGIETSCDETSAAVVEDGVKLLSNVVASQVDVHSLYGGVVPEIASRAHAESISAVVAEAIEKSGVKIYDIGAVAVTYAPGLIGALLAGLSFAKGLSYALGVPLVPVHHIRGHVAANYLARPSPKPPFFALVVSGGHTSLIKVEDYAVYSTIGSTRDDAAGEAFDKAARVMGLPYPGGAAMDTLAEKGDPGAVKFPSPRVEGHEFDFSFSGLKTSLINYVANNGGEQCLDQKTKADIAASFTFTLVKAVTDRLERLFIKKGNLPLVLAGGVAANSHLRKSVTLLCEKHGAELFMPPISLCGDNAAMIASQGFFELLAGNISQKNQNAYASLGV